MSKATVLTVERYEQACSLLREAGFSEREIMEFEDSMTKLLVGEEE